MSRAMGHGGERERYDRLWNKVAELVERNAADVAGLAFHGLGPLAAELLETRGAPVPRGLRRHQERMRVVALTMPFVLECARDATEDPILIVKGPEVARRYPGEARAYGDIDVLVRDAAKTQRELVAAGFVERDDPEGIWAGIHHLPPVRLPGTMLAIEVHSEPKWLDGLRRPRTEELFAEAVPSRVGVDGVLGPAPAHHALLLAAHAWAHQPLGRVRDLVDVGAFRAEADPALLERTAHDWGVSRLWRTVSAALDAMLSQTSTLPLALWARHLRELRDQTVLETHLERLLAPIWGYPPSHAPKLVGAALLNELRPAFDEDWRGKSRRMIAALRRPSTPISSHRQMLGESATRGERPGGASDAADGDVQAPGAPQATRSARSAARGRH